MIIRVIDCETTGLEAQDQVVEIGSIDLNIQALAYENSQTTLVRPTVPIPSIASSIHHITDEMVSSFPEFNVAIEQFRGADVYAAHNAKFDRMFLGDLSKNWICTHKCALVIWPDAPAHSNQVLRYELRLPGPGEEAGYPHRALYDATTTAQILAAMISAGYTVDQLLQISANPVLLPKIAFGKHRGEKWQDLPLDYLEWMERNGDWDEDVAYTLDQELSRRRTKGS